MTESKIRKIAGDFIGIIAVILLSPFFLLYLLVKALIRAYIRVRLTTKWPSDKYILFVYSESEHWAPYIEQNLLPSIREYAIVINRTKQKNWKSDFHIEKQALELWSHIEANPIAIVFKPYKKVRTFHFFEAFRDFKQGKEAKLNSISQEFYNYVSLPSA